MKKAMVVDVRGKRHKWGFLFYGDPKDLAEWRADGLEVYEVENIVPAWAVAFGLGRLWCIGQDLLNFKNPWR